MSPRPQRHLNVDYSAATKRLSTPVLEHLTGELRATLDVSFPAGFNLSIVDKSDVLFRAWGGHECVVGDVVATLRHTRYDLASLTKVVATTTLALWLEENGHWKLSDRVATRLPGFPRDDLTLHQLITHTSGLVPHRPFFHLGQHPQAIRRAVFDESTLGGPTGNVLYSDLNFMLLGWAIAQCTQRPFDRLFREVVADPLSMRHSRFRPAVRDRPLIGATELDGDQRLEPGLIWGEVHDGNAWALKGVAGHAGLFATCDDVSFFVSALLRPRRHPVLGPSTIARMSRYHAGHAPDARGLGWRLGPNEWGPWPSDTYWHTGFTGTSILVAPSANVGVVLLMNAVHPKRNLARQAKVRTAIHQAIAKALS